MSTILLPRAPTNLCLENTKKMTKSIKNTRDGYHFNSFYWQNSKISIPCMSQELNDIAYGMLLGDASMYRVSHEAYMKFEQGYKQKVFVDLLFQMFHSYCFMNQPGIRFETSQDTCPSIKSYWFKTFSHPVFSQIFEGMYKYNGKKSVKTLSEGLIRNSITSRSLAYWVMCDGSLQNTKKTLVLYSAGFSQEENNIASFELNEKFGFKSCVISHKKKYFVIQIPAENALLVKTLISPYMLPLFSYKIPKQL